MIEIAFFDNKNYYLWIEKFNHEKWKTMEWIKEYKTTTTTLNENQE